MINAGADPNLPITWTGSTPLQITVGNKRRAKQQFDIVKLLIDKGADPYIKNSMSNLIHQDAFQVADNWNKKMLKQYMYDCLKEKS
jgi:ankyrin repeat protein